MGNLDAALNELDDWGKADDDRRVVWLALRRILCAYDADQDKPRMMTCPHGKGTPHKWTRECEDCDCTPLSPAPKEKPRMMQANPDGQCHPHQKTEHEWRHSCDSPPACTPVSPAPKHKLEAGCKVEYTIAGNTHIMEVATVTPFCVFLINGRAIGITLVHVTAPATPEVGDYVLVHARGSDRRPSGILTSPQHGKDEDAIWEVTIRRGGVDGRLTQDWVVHRDEFTIIAKALHARELVEDTPIE